MRKTIIMTLFALLLASGPALAQFEGVLELKMTMTSKGASGGGTINVAIAKAGTRSDMNMQMGHMNMKMVVLQRSDASNTVYQINDASKTYTEIDMSKTREKAAEQETQEYTVEKLGQEDILGYKTQHILVKQKNPEAGKGITTELWTAKDVLSYEAFNKLQVRRGKWSGGSRFVQALKDAGADGLPLKAVTTSPDGGQVITEVVSIQKKAPPASLFEIPAGYTKSASGPMNATGGMSGPQSDEAKQKMQEALKNMSPEQRERVEKMMKQRQSGSQQ